MFILSCYSKPVAKLLDFHKEFSSIDLFVCLGSYLLGVFVWWPHHHSPFIHGPVMYYTPSLLYLPIKFLYAYPIINPYTKHLSSFFCVFRMTMKRTHVVRLKKQIRTSPIRYCRWIYLLTEPSKFAQVLPLWIVLEFQISTWTP